MTHATTHSLPDVQISLPDWAADELGKLPSHFPSLEDRMRAVIRFSRLNFERDTGRLVVIGVNRVTPLGCSSAHAEVVALSVAQKMLGVYDLGGPGLPAH